MKKKDGWGMADCQMFFMDTAKMLEAGIPLQECMELLDEEYHGRTAGLYQETCAFHESLREAGFPGYAVHIVQAGEESGRLPECMKGLSMYYGDMDRLHLAVDNLVCKEFFMLALLMMAIFSLLGQCIPYAMHVLMQNGMAGNGEIGTALKFTETICTFATVLFGISVVSLLFWHALIPRNVRFDTIMPLVKKKVRKQETACRFLSSFSLTFLGNLPYEQCFLSTVRLFKDGGMRAKIGKASSLGTIHDGLTYLGILDKHDLRMVYVGEKTGTLDEVMQEIARNSHDRLHNSISKLSDRMDSSLTIIWAWFFIILFALFVIPTAVTLL